MPYFVPAWALRTIGTSTMRLASRTVRTACHQLMPPAIRAEASVYVGMQAARATHRAAMSHRPQVRCPGAVGAMSRLEYAEFAMSPGGGRGLIVMAGHPGLRLRARTQG